MTESEDPKPQLAPMSVKLWGGFAVAALVVVLCMFVGKPTQLAPDHADTVVSCALGAGILVAIGAVAMVMTGRLEVRSNRTVGAIGLAIGTFILGFFGMMFAVDRVLQSIDFPASSTIQYERYFPIERAYLGSKHRYHIQLDEYFADMLISEADYKRFGDSRDDIRPQGFCLHAMAQQSGDALRIMQDESWAFRTGSVVPCPPKPALATPTPRH